MGDKSSIEWTDATWNPVTGCTEVSPGCDHCYAKTFAERWRGIPGHHFEQGFDVTLRPERLDQPLRWKKPRRIFVNSMSDLFHDAVPDGYIARVFATMARAPQHTFQLLTKRHGRMRALVGGDIDGGHRLMEALADEAEAQALYDASWPLPNVWLGVSVENQQWANIRIPALLDTPATVRFISAEPLLGPVDLSRWLGPVDWPKCWDSHGPFNECSRCIQPEWVIVGGESGPGARPIHPAWVRGLRDQCVAADVPFFFKQWGEWIPESLGAHVITEHSAKGARYADLDGGHRPANIGSRGSAATCHRVGKKAAGRELDGRTWDEFPGGAR